jgi:dihydroorotase
MQNNDTVDILIRHGQCVSPKGISRADIAIRNGRIMAVGDGLSVKPREVIDAQHLHVLPGVIDSQVHFREPGLEHKEDLATGTAAAVLGGVTTVFEMPNTKPGTVDEHAFTDKIARSCGRVFSNIGFFMGVSAENADDLARLELLPGCVGVKVFMGSSTGSLLVPDDETLERVLSSGRRRVAVHAEDESRLKEREQLVKGADVSVSMHPEWRDEESALRATKRALSAGRKTGRPLHILHVTTAEEMDLLKEHKDVATVEVTPQHLTLTAPDCYERLGTYAQMNPPIRSARHREALWRAVSEGIVDVVGSDHAPHTREEKQRPYPASPSGMPGVQTILPLMLNHVAAGQLSLERLTELLCTGPARLYDVRAKGAIAPGMDADLTLVDLGTQRRIDDVDMASRCGWTPFHGMTVTGWPIMTLVAGRVAMRDGAIQGPAAGRIVTFSH